MTVWWLSCDRLTVVVVLDENEIIVEGAPIVRKFIGQPSRNLGRWMRDIGGFQAKQLT